MDIRQQIQTVIFDKKGSEILKDVFSRTLILYDPVDIFLNVNLTDCKKKINKMC